MRSLRYFAAAALAALALACQAAQERPVYDPSDPSSRPVISDYPTIIESLFARGENLQALEMVDQGLARNPLSVQLAFQRCVALEKLGRLDEARLGLQKLIDKFPEIAEPYNNLAVLKAEAGDVDGAEALLRKAVILRPDFAAAWANLGDLYLARARSSYETAAKIAPGTTRAERRLEMIREFPHTP